MCKTLMSKIGIGENLLKFKDPFDVAAFVENIVSQHGFKFKGVYDASELSLKIQDFLLEKTKELKNYLLDIHKIIDTTSQACYLSQKAYINDLEAINKTLNTNSDTLKSLSDNFQSIDKVITGLAKTLVVHNTSVSRCKTLLHLISSFNMFLKSEDPFPVPQNFDEVLKLFGTLESLKKISKSIKGEKFIGPRQAISACHSRFQEVIFRVFIEELKTENTIKMRSVISAIILPETIQSFNISIIEFCQNESHDINDVVGSQGKGFIQASLVLRHVMGHNYKIFNNLYLQKLFEGRFIKYLNQILDNTSPSNFVQNLYLFYEQINKIENNVYKNFSAGIESSAFDYYKKMLCKSYLNRYMDMEINHLSSFYKKTTLHALNVPEKDIVASTILQDICINFIQEIKNAQRRCEKLTPESELSKNTAEIFKFLVDNFGNNFCAKLIDSYIKYLNTNESKVEMNINFFYFVEQITTSIDSLQKYYNDFAVIHLSSTSYHDSTTKVLNQFISSAESKTDCCIDKYLNICLNCIKNKISYDLQAKSSLYSGAMTIQSKDVIEVCSYLKSFNEEIATTLNKSNYKRTGLEWAIRFTRWLIQYHKDFTYSVEGAIIALMDVKGYKSAFSCFKVHEIDNIFDLIYSLFNVMVVEAQDVKNYCHNEGYIQKHVDPQLIQAFVESRMDFRDSKIGKIV